MRDPQEYLRSTRGRGKIFDDAEVHRSAYLGRDAIAAQQAKLRDCSVGGKSYVAENARVFGGQITDSYIGGDVVIAGSPVIVASVIRGESVTGKPNLTHCTTFDNAEVCDDVHIIGESIDKTIVISDSALVYGTTMLVGHFEVKGRTRINSGVWKRPPRHIDLGFVAITESKTGAMVDCRDRSLQYWEQHGAKLGERWGWDQKQIAAALTAVRYVVG
jgi:NDP-sugar pyrophosphorylase family protein